MDDRKTRKRHHRDLCEITLVTAAILTSRDPDTASNNEKKLPDMRHIVTVVLNIPTR
jgi:hypothetical protein